MEQIVITHLDGSTQLLRSSASVSNITKATQTVELMSQDLVDITVESAAKIDFLIGDKITVFGRDYTLNIPAKEIKTSENSFQYILQFEGAQYDLIRPLYNVNIDTTSNEIQDLNGDSLTGDLKRFLDVLISNANRVFPGKWSLGTYPTGTETKTLTFSDSDNCLSVLQSLCSTENYSTEFDIVINVDGTRTINIGTAGTTHTTTYEYGKGKGMYELTREKTSNSNIVTRLYVYGSSRNLTYKYRSTNLCLPTKSKSESFLEDAAAIAKYGYWENKKTFEDIYPHREGAISALGLDVYSFVDSSMNFDLNEKETDGVTTKYLMAGTSAKIHFNSGNLAGYEFEIQSYDHATKTFRIIKLTDERDMSFPSETSAAFQFAAGDKYVIIDIYMPDSYITAAETELSTKGAEYFEQNSQPKVQYSLKLDQFFIRNLHGETPQNIFWTGDYIPIYDADINVDKSIRIKGFRRDLLNEFSYDLTISDLAVTVSTATRIISEVIDHDKIIRYNNLKDPARARRNYLASQELLTMLNNIQAEMLLIVSNGGEYDTSVQFTRNVGGNANRITSTSGQLVHAKYIDGAQGGIWNITASDATLTNEAIPYFIYFKCNRGNGSGTIFYSPTKIGVEDQALYYHFPYAIASSVIEGTRVFTNLKGATQIIGDGIKTGTIEGNGLKIDLNEGTAEGAFTFKAGSSGYENLTDRPDLSSFAIESEVNALIAGLQTQIDGNITTWFYAYAPTLSNAPASAWTTTVLKDAHLGDLFYDTATGYAYRYQKAGTVYSWQKISDSDITAALAAASAAQDTADGKRRVFVATPTTPYDIGDLWSQGTAGDLMKCKTARASGSYTASDWEKASKYTDDTVANAAAAAATAAQTSANNALTAINDIIADNVLSGSEKPTQRLEWNIIAAEKSGLNTQATTFSITSENTAYNTAFQTLANYLNNGTTWSSGIPSWLSDANLATNTTIVGSTYRTNWANLYAARTNLLNAIATKAKTLADAAQITADNAAITASQAQSNATTALTQINGIVSDSVLSGAEKPAQRQAWNIIQAEKAGINTQATAFGITTENTAYNTAFQTLATYLNAGAAWSSGIPSWLADANLGSNTTIVGTTYRTNWTNLYNARTTLLNKIALYAKSADYVLNAIKQDTTVQGGLLSTTLIKVGATNQNGQWIERAGINGASGSDDTPTFYGGGTLAQAVSRVSGIITNAAKFVVTRAGIVYATAVNLIGSLSTAPAGGKRIVLNQETNSIEIYDDNDDLKTIISSDTTPALSTLLASSSASGNVSASTSVMASNSTPQVNNTANTNSITLPATVDIYKVTTPVINYTVNASVGAQGGQAYVKVEAYLIVNGISFYLDMQQYQIAYGQTTVGVTGQFTSKIINNVQPGSCYIRIAAYASLIPSTSSEASCSITLSGTLAAVGLNQKSKVFLDGAFFMQNASHYAYMSPDHVEFNSNGRVLRLKGTGNANDAKDGFGILRSATINSAGGVANNVIGVISNATADGSGQYTISHAIGHTNYTVLITPYDTAGSRNGITLSKATGSCVVKLYNGSSGANQRFDITIIGY